MAQKIIMTDGTRSETLYRTKSLNPWTDDTPGVWSPDPTDIRKQAKSTRLVPSVFAGIHARMQAMMDLPFSIYKLKGDEPVDTSDNYKNVVGFLPDPQRVLGLTEAALATNGKAYWYKGTGTRSGALKLLKYWMPDSVMLDPNKAKNGEIVFKRQGVNDKTFSAEEVLHFWLYDESVEIGPPTIWPLLSATIAAEAGGAIGTWVRDYMRRGAIKAMLLAVDGAPPAAEVERIETWWNKFMSGMRGLTWKVFNMQTITPTIVGDGLEALKDLSITKELRYEVHQALGTRHLLEDENYATAQARERQFYTITVMPDARLIQAVFNEQILTPMGYQLIFEPERLEIMQEDEAARAESLSKLFDVFAAALGAPQALNLSMDILGYDISKEQQKIIDEGIAAKEKEKAEMQKQQEEAAAVQAEANKPTPPSKAMMELDWFEEKVKRTGAMVMWHPRELSAEMVSAIREGTLSFEAARAQLQPSAMQTPAPEYKSEIILLADALNNYAAKAVAEPAQVQPIVIVNNTRKEKRKSMAEAFAKSAFAKTGVTNEQPNPSE